MQPDVGGRLLSGSQQLVVAMGPKLKAKKKGELTGGIGRGPLPRLAKAPGALPRLIYIGNPHINWPSQGPWSLGKPWQESSTSSS